MAGVLSVYLTDLAFNYLPGQAGPILSELDGDIVLTVADDFPTHKITLLAADERAVRSIDPNILPCGCIVNEEGLGEVARGYILDPAGQINNDGHTITLNIPNQTESLRWDTTAPGYVAATGLDTLTHRLASRSPPWKASVVDTGSPVVSVQPVHWQANDPAFSNADLNTFTKNDGLAGAWNVGAATAESVLSGDCALTTVAFGCNTNRMFGFTSNFNTYSYEMMNHAIYLSTDGLNTPTSGLLYVFENGVNKGLMGKYNAGDVLSVAIINGQVQYLINNVIFYSSGLAPSYPCLGACSVFDANAAILGGMWTSYVAPKDTYYAIGYENQTILDALMQLAQKTFRHIRQKQVNGIPVQELELGLFNAPPTMTLKTSDGESPSQLRARNLYTRLLTPQIDYGWTTSQIITIGAAFGGGTGDTQVTLRHLYDYLHPLYAAPTPRNNTYTGAPFYPLFPEYLPNDFPIERRVSLNGKYYYVVKNLAAIGAMKAKGHWSGELWGDISDSSISYVDKSPDAQQMAVERTLYIECVTKLRQHGEKHFTATLQVEGRGRVTQAGDQVNVQIRRIGRGRSQLSQRAFMEVNVNVNPMVMQWTRKYRESDVTDEVKVSTLGRLLQNDAQALHQTLQQMEAVRVIATMNDQTVVIGPIEQTINTIFPLDIPIQLPNTMYRMTSASLRITAKPARHNVRLAQGAQLDGAHDHSMTIPPLTVGITPLPFHQHTTYTKTHNHGGITANLGVFNGITEISHGHTFTKGAHSHKILAQNPFIDTGVPDGSNALKFNAGPYGKNGETVVTKVWFVAFMNQQTGGGHTHGEDPAVTYTQNPSVDSLGATNKGLSNAITPLSYATDTLFDFNMPFTAAGDNSGYPGNQLIGMTTIQNLNTRTDDPLHAGLHTHSLFPDVVETNLGSSFQLWINSGDGVYVDRSPELGGPWVARDAIILGNVNGDNTGMEKFLQAPGKGVGLRVVAINSAGNPTGIQNVQVSGTWEFEKSAISSTIFAG